MYKNIIFAIAFFFLIIGLIVLSNKWMQDNVVTVSGETAAEMNLKTLDEVVNERKIMQEKEEVKQFVIEYFKAVYDNDFNKARKEFLDDKGLMLMVISCGTREDQEEGLKILENNSRLKFIWQRCAYFSGYRMEILGVNKINENNYEVVIQFYDDRGNPVGIDEHPEWEGGRYITVVRYPKIGLKVRDWFFFE